MNTNHLTLQDFNNNLLKSFYVKPLSFNDALSVLNDNFNKSLISEELYEKAVEQLDTIVKAKMHKYYKREGVKGNYKYYYTKEEYEKEKGGKESKTPSGEFKIGDVGNGVIVTSKKNARGMFGVETLYKVKGGDEWWSHKEVEEEIEKEKSSKGKKRESKINLVKKDRDGEEYVDTKKYESLLRKEAKKNNIKIDEDILEEITDSISDLTDAYTDISPTEILEDYKQYLSAAVEDFLDENEEALDAYEEEHGINGRDYIMSIDNLKELKEALEDYL